MISVSSKQSRHIGLELLSWRGEVVRQAGQKVDEYGLQFEAIGGVFRQSKLLIELFFFIIAAIR